MRGATSALVGTGSTAIVSIHAPVRGATKRIRTPHKSRTCFNPRAREGRDRRSNRMLEVGNVVSIHAPVRGATIYADGKVYLVAVSIHAPVRGATWRNSGAVAA